MESSCGKAAHEFLLTSDDTLICLLVAIFSVSPTNGYHDNGEGKSRDLRCTNVSLASGEFLESR